METIEQSSFDRYFDLNWKLILLRKFRVLKKLLTYGERERALVELQIAKRCLRKALGHQVEVKQVYEIVQEAEMFFEEKRFDDCVEECKKAVRKVQVKQTGSVDEIFHGRRISRKYGEVPVDEVERRHIVLKAASMAEINEGLFTEKQAQNILEEAFEDSESLNGLLNSVSTVLENHDEVEAEESFAGVTLYSFKK